MAPFHLRFFERDDGDAMLGDESDNGRSETSVQSGDVQDAGIDADVQRRDCQKGKCGQEKK